jgi:hypothetical protein
MSFWEIADLLCSVRSNDGPVTVGMVRAMLAQFPATPDDAFVEMEGESILRVRAARDVKENTE